jgi:hypothetical protein
MPTMNNGFKVKGKVVPFERTPALRLATLSKDANEKLLSIVVDIETRLVNIKRDLFEIGKLLSNAKQILPHGMFQPWIEKTFARDLPYSTAYAYMMIFEHFQNSPQTVQLLPISFLMCMTRETFPQQIKEIIEENAQHLKSEDVKAIKEAYSAFKNGTISLGRFSSIAKRKIQLGITIERGITNRRITTNARSLLHHRMDYIVKAIRELGHAANKMQYLFAPVEGSMEEADTIRRIDMAIDDLQKLKRNLEGKVGLFKPVTSVELGMQPGYSAATCGCQFLIPGFDATPGCVPVFTRF